MITREQVEHAKTMWEQARLSAEYAHVTWALLQQSSKALIDSFRKAGFPASQAAREFEKLMADHSEKYRMALAQMDAMSETYAQLLEEFRKASS